MKHTKTCKECGEIFDTNLSKQVFCTWECSTSRNKNRYYESGLYLPKKKKRFEILERDEFRCIYCGRSPIEDKVKLEIDHINPRNGANNNILKYDKEELITSCSDCNNGKSNKKISIDVIKRIGEQIK